MSEMLGFLAALISAIGWGSYFVPMKKLTKYNPFYFQALMATGIFLSSIVFVAISGKFVISVFGLLSGFLWVIGNACSAIAVEKNGLSKAAPLWMGIGMLTSFALGVLLFNEALSNFLFAILGLIMLIVGTVIISSLNSSKTGTSRIGIVLAAVAGIIFGSYLTPLKISGLQATEFLFSMSLGILIFGWGFFFFRRTKLDKRIVLNGLASGTIWNIANFSSLFAILYLGISIGFPLTQNALLVSVLWGLLYFKEIKQKNKIVQIVVGALILIAGAFLIGFSK